MLEFYHVNQTTQWRSYDKARQDMKIVIRELLYHSKVTVKKKMIGQLSKLLVMEASLILFHK